MRRKAFRNGELFADDSAERLRSVAKKVEGHMRRAFAACVAFAVLVVVAVIRFGFNGSSPSAPPRPRIDHTAVADAAIGDARVALDAQPIPKKHPTERHPTRSSHTEPTTVLPPPAPAPVISTSGKKGCSQPANPTGCPAAEPNVNHPCDAEGVQCVYGTSCCPPVYVCNGGVFEAWLTHCP